MSGHARWYGALLVCPDCLPETSLDETDGGYRCPTCDRIVAAGPGRPLDCHPRYGDGERPSAGRRDWPPPPDGVWAGPISPRVSPRHLSVLAASGTDLAVLDWGCGTGEYRPIVAGVMGHRYVGLDLAGPDADVLGTAHRLPFRADAFDHVITNAVLEHVADPFVAVAEVARVLRPGGRFSGSVAFLEPHHAGSYFHMTADAVALVVGRAGLTLEGLWPPEGWSVFDSLATMPGPISSPSRWLLRAVARWERFARSVRLRPTGAPTGRWLTRRSDAERREQLLVVAGQIDFLARKPR